MKTRLCDWYRAIYLALCMVKFSAMCDCYHCRGSPVEMYHEISITLSWHLALILPQWMVLVSLLTDHLHIAWWLVTFCVSLRKDCTELLLLVFHEMTLPFLLICLVSRATNSLIDPSLEQSLSKIVSECLSVHLMRWYQCPCVDGWLDSTDQFPLLFRCAHCTLIRDHVSSNMEWMLAKVT